MNKKLMTFLTIGVCSSAFVVRAETLGYWDFAGGEIGTDVTSAADKSGEGGCGIALTGSAVGTAGIMPTYVDAPGKYIYSRMNGGTLLTSDARGVKFSGSETSASVGSVLTGDGLGTLISQQTGGFTLEFFFREDVHVDWRILAGSAIGDPSYLDIAGRDNSTLVGVMTSAGAPVAFLNTEWSKSEGWHHFALRWNATTEKMDFYLDYALHGTAFSWVNPEKTDTPWHFGCGRAKGSCFNGRFAAIRLSSGVLNPEEFLVARTSPQECPDASTLVFADFSEGTVGADAPATAIATCGEIGTCVAQRKSTSDAYPVYSDDVPGKAILSRAVGGTVLSAAPKSVDITANNSMISRHLSTLLSRCSAFTVEYFAKAELNQQWQTVMEVRLDQTIRSSYNSGTQFFLQTVDGNKNYFCNASWTGYQQWHHVAVSWDGVTTRLYLDRALSASNTDMPTLTDLVDVSKHVLFGSEFTGKLSAVRVSSKALAPEEMMVATETADSAWDDGHTIFHWGFDEGAVADGADLVAGTADPINVPQLRPVGAYSVNRLPAYDQTAINANRRKIYSGEACLGENRAAAKFFGPSTESPGWTASHVFMMAPISDFDLAPDTLTYEFFFRRNLASDQLQTECQGQLIAAFAQPGASSGAYAYDWHLTKARADDRIFFSWFGRGASESSNVLLTTLSDDKWHHFALVKAGDDFKVYLDGDEKLSNSNGMRKSDGYTYTFGAGNAIGGFNGWIDEVRLSDIARPTSDFLRFARPTGLMLLLR